MNQTNPMKFNVYCKCGGSLAFNVASVNYDKQYICPNCSANLGAEIIDLLNNVKNSLEHHCRDCNQLHNVQNVFLNGQLI